MIITRKKLDRLTWVYKKVYSYYEELEDIIESLPDCKELGTDKLEARCWGMQYGVMDAVEHILSIAECPDGLVQPDDGHKEGESLL